ncbi:MAG: MFS transporter, partial [Clostridia bacterium]|nr:MFS transporter [Clostridia bacterium]
ASALTSTLFGYPVGALADRFGRKKVLYVTIPLFWLSNILLIIAPNPFTLVIAGMLQGFFHITAPLAGAVQRELVSQDVMGVWIGFTKLTNAIASAVMAIVAGVLYDKVGPMWCFLIFIGLDAFIRMPLLASIPETLGKQSQIKS